MISQEGEHKPYLWIVINSSGNFRGLGSILKVFPQLVKDTTILIPIFDSEHLDIGPEQEAEGWEKRGDCVVIKDVQNMEDFPIAENSEYYLFTEDNDLVHMPEETFVDDIFFVPTDDNHEFWNAIKKVNPETVIIERDFTFIASKNERLILALKQRFSE